MLLPLEAARGSPAHKPVCVGGGEIDKLHSQLVLGLIDKLHSPLVLEEID